jgi:predicted membrane channel-forming protein YqfA (hemolysin III family)
VAVTVAFFGLRTYVGAILTVALTGVPSWAGTAVLWTMVLIALAGIPLNLWHLVLVCCRRRSTARTALLVVQAVFVLIFFAVGWVLILVGTHYGTAR